MGANHFCSQLFTPLTTLETLPGTRLFFIHRIRITIHSGPFCTSSSATFAPLLLRLASCLAFEPPPPPFGSSPVHPPTLSLVAISLPRGLGPAPGPRARSLGYRPSRRPHHTHPGPPHHGHGSGPGDRAHVPSPAWLPLSSWPHTHPWRTPHVAPRLDGNTHVFAPHAARDPTLG